MNPLDNHNLSNNNISEILGLSVTNGPSIGGSNPGSKSNSFIGSRVTHNFKIILVGDASVGKTCLISRYCDNKIIDKHATTLSITTKKKKYNPDQMNSIDLEIYDTCGEEKFKALTRSYFRYAQGAILMFDLTNPSPFLSLNAWLDDLRANSSKDIEIILVGNKNDLPVPKSTRLEADKFAKETNLQFFEISALYGLNVELLFETLANKLIKKEQAKSEMEGVKLKQNVFYKQQVMKQMKAGEKKNGQDVGCC